LLLLDVHGALQDAIVRHKVFIATSQAVPTRSVPELLHSSSARYAGT
jgi:hypothetical protein